MMRTLETAIQFNIEQITLKALKNRELLSILPELYALQAVHEQSDWHNDSPFEQSLRLYKFINELPHSLPAEASLHSPELLAILNESIGRYTVQKLLALATLLHDLGKADTFITKPDGTTQCPGHEAHSARLAPAICTRIGLNSAETQFVTTLVAEHGAPYQLYKETIALETVEQRQFRQQFEQKHLAYLVPLQLLAWGDLLTSHMLKLKPEKFASINKFYQGWFTETQNIPEIRLNSQQVEQTILRNQSPSYGLTLVAGCPFPAPLSQQIKDIQYQLEALAPGRFSWYAPQHLHSTLMAPLRGRYRDKPALSKSELPSDLPAFIADLNRFFTQQMPFQLNLRGLYLLENGLLKITENRLSQQLAHLMAPYSALDVPKTTQGLHITIGYLGNSAPIQAESFAQKLNQLAEYDFEPVEINKIWLVHYANRTLNQIIGKIGFDLGKQNNYTAEEVCQLLKLN